LIAIGGNPYDVRVKNNRLYCMRGKKSGYQELVVYKMTWEQSTIKPTRTQIPKALASLD
jgi:hypothetical protein